MHPQATDVHALIHREASGHLVRRAPNGLARVECLRDMSLEIGISDEDSVRVIAMWDLLKHFAQRGAALYSRERWRRRQLERLSR